MDGCLGIEPRGTVIRLAVALRVCGGGGGGGGGGEELLFFPQTKNGATIECDCSCPLSSFISLSLLQVPNGLA